MTRTQALRDALVQPPRLETTAPDSWSSLGYGLGMLAFLFWPTLIPGTGFQLAVLEACGIALAGYLAVCLYGVYASLRSSVRRRAAMHSRSRRTARRGSTDR